jgi:hypothetical protein
MTARWRALLLLLVLAFPASLLAKGVTSRIVLSGGDLMTPVEITGPAASSISVWSGRGTFSNGVEGREGFIVDWRTGTVPPPPAAARRYEVSFYVTGPRGEPERLAYVVLYVDGPRRDTGLVYLPGRQDRWYTLNVRSIARGQGVEGNWFRATEEWRRLVQAVVR